MKKLSASALSCYLDSPRKFYWSYVQRIEPIMPSVATFDHDKICGTIWSEFVDRFYKGIDEAKNRMVMLTDWHERTDGWCSPKAQEKLTEALNSWATAYYQLYSHDDGVRTGAGSEKFVENDRFLGFLDGISDDRILHEVKSTSRSKAISEQLWKVQNSLQVKLYCVLAQAEGIRIEFAWKDSPHGIYRSEPIPVTAEQRKEWEVQLNTLADHIYSLGDDPAKYPCHPDGCCIVTKNFLSMCQFQTLCEMGYNDFTKVAYTERKSTRKT